ncbi:MAG: hypothetical protein VW230_02900 [Candidatus Poseidoniales archaeon]|nr:hypothetical protein [archaeon]MDA0842777.1 hypothetical protein [archaeon]MDA1168571.1 hypothetical protein [archaeon]
MSEEEKRIAAIMAVMSLIEGSDDQRGQVGRQTGHVWAQDHRRMLSGRQSVLHQRASRSPWR